MKIMLVLVLLFCAFIAGSTDAKMNLSISVDTEIFAGAAGGGGAGSMLWSTGGDNVLWSTGGDGIDWE